MPRSVVVSGGAAGIGAAAARRLAGDGFSVVVVDLSEAAEAVARGIRDDGGQATAVIGDVTREETWAAAVGSGVDALVANAYAKTVKPLHEQDRAEWTRQLEVNLTGTYLGVRACLPSLTERKGSIVLVSSVHALFGLPGHSAYAASKGGLVSLGRQLAVEYAPAVRVNTVLPGPILTQAWDGVSDADLRRSVESTPAGRLGDPAEVASAIAFLVSTGASFISGAELLVDGGWSAAKDSA
jgi:NAD(P)-dependent dehydrogenase (short-subunit alcohol dehydrogenase family)